MSTLTIAAWCRACGADDGGGPAVCVHCGLPLDLPAPGQARAGLVVEVKGRLGSRNGIVLREAAGTLEILTKGDSPVSMTLEQFDAAAGVSVPGPEVIGAAGRLWRAMGAQASGAVRAKWRPEVVAAAALAHATASTGSRRAAAIDALALGFADAVPRLGLAEPETCWYLALAAARAGKAADVIGFLERLPAGGYAGRVAMLLRCASELLADAALAARAAALLEPFTAADLDARALRAALAVPGTADVIEPLVAFAVAAENGDGPLAEGASSIARLELPGTAFPAAVPTARALAAYLAGRSGAAIDAGADVLGRLPVVLIDELIDLRAVAAELARQPGWAAASGAYIRCRLDPGGAAASDLLEAGFTAELARRRYLAADSDGLRELPGDDPDVRHYGALAAWAASGREPEPEALRPAARQLLNQVSALLAAVKSGGDATVPGALASDPTCWPLLWDAALQGALRLPDPLAESYPRFADWLDLVGLQRHVFGSRWTEVAALGQALAARTAIEATSDEALNMVAFADFQLGGADKALGLLDTALGGRYTTGLLVNASVVAAAKGSVAGLPYLAQIARTERDPAVRSGAVQRAIELWAQDAASPEYPQTLRELVREALAVPQADEFHHTLLTVADSRDPDWLAASAGVRADGADQQADLRYRQTWARARTAGYPETLESVARVLTGLAAAKPPPRWAAAELARFIESINEAIHTTFGEAVHLGPVIEVLLAAEVLDPRRQLVLAAQAGAHEAVARADSGGSIRPEIEQRLIFDTVRRYLERRPQMSEAEREYVGEELSRCVAMAANAMGKAAEREIDTRMKRWNELVRREQYEPQNRNVILRLQRDVLDEMEAFATRVRAYLNSMRDLPLSEAGQSVQSGLSAVLSQWSAEIGRLRRFL